MQYIATPDWEDGTADLTERLINELSAGKRVLWLLSGGSNIAVSAKIMESISEELTQALTISLIDERYGPVGHTDSNWHQVMTAGFNPKQATALPMLVEGLDMARTAAAYDRTLAEAFAANDVTIAQLGMGDDGHISGIKPNSPAAIEQTALVIGYAWDDYQRITTTPVAFAHITANYLFVFGEAKHAAVEKLQTQDVPIVEQPAQLLKTLPEAYLYSDQIGDTI